MSLGFVLAPVEHKHVVVELDPTSPSADGGLRNNDRFAYLDGIDVQSTPKDALKRALIDSTRNGPVVAVVYRKCKQSKYYDENFLFCLGALLPGQVHTSPMGVTIEHPADFTLTQKPNCVISINPNGPAASNGLRINDTITAVNNSSVLQFTPENLTTQLEYVTLAGSVTARIVRTG